MADPRRIRFRRVKGWRLPADSVYVGRPSAWGNPYLMAGEAQRQFVVDRFRDFAERMLRLDPAWLDPLRGKRLACACPLELPCHADVLIELTNG
jgi:hypothetical protein